MHTGVVVGPDNPESHCWKQQQGYSFVAPFVGDLRAMSPRRGRSARPPRAAPAVPAPEGNTAQSMTGRRRWRRPKASPCPRPPWVFQPAGPTTEPPSLFSLWTLRPTRTNAAQPLRAGWVSRHACPHVSPRMRAGTSGGTEGHPAAGPTACPACLAARAQIHAQGSRLRCRARAGRCVLAAPGADPVGGPYHGTSVPSSVDGACVRTPARRGGGWGLQGTLPGTQLIA